MNNNCSFDKKHLKKVTFFILVMLAFLSVFLCINRYVAHAEDGAIPVDGFVFEFGKNSKYECSSSEYAGTVSSGLATYGQFSVSGAISEITEYEGLTLFGVDGGNIDFSYTYSDLLLNAPEEEWHLISDGGKIVDGFELDEKIQKGAVIIQTSKDGAKWVDTYTKTNAFEDVPTQTESFYSTTDTQLKNGCYYRIYIVYETKRKTDPTKIWFVNFDNYEYVKHAEYYTFYAYDINETIASVEAEKEPKYCFSDKVNTGLDNGYSGANVVDKDDLHYGWDLGEFFVRGYSRRVEDKEGNPIFLKNTGDERVLYFNLEQDIDALNGDQTLTISSDDKGYDKYFEIPQTYMGRGTLIIKYTDYQNVSHDPGADTIVQLCDEGDYEVTLDYEVKNSKHEIFGIDIFPEYSNYKIFFKFSIRNGKCNVYPMDLLTGADLSNRSYTETGFVLDLAFSRYLEINIKHEMLNEENDELVQVDYYDNLAREGSTFTEEGVYTISAKNIYTGQEVVKVLYVGSNDLLKAYAKTGIPYSEIKSLISRGATIDKYGDLDLTSVNDTDESEKLDPINSNDKEGFEPLVIMFYGMIGLIGIIIVLIVALILLSKSRKKYKKLANSIVDAKKEE